MRRYLLIGGTGSLGQKLIEKLLPNHDLSVFSRDEAKHWTIRNAWACGPQAARAQAGLTFVVGDVRDQKRVHEVLRQAAPDVVIIASALKQVDTCEQSPYESIQTNLLGVQNVVRAVAEMGGPSHLVLVSTDKACAPVNVYGMCKALAERVVTSQACTGRPGVYLAVRYGNVLESRGSIIPLFRYQADHADCLTVTDPEMTRFVMTLDQSVQLIEHAIEVGQSGETWIPRLPAMRIGDLADLFSRRSQKPVKIVGLRPGEKRHEDLICASESVRTRAEGSHYVIGPALGPAEKVRFTYTSADQVLPADELSQLLGRLLDLPLDQFVGRRIEEIRKDGQEVPA